MTDTTPSARPSPTPAAAGRCSPACPGRRSPPPARLPRRHHRRAADHRLVRPPPRPEPGHRHRRPRPRRPGRRPARPGRERVRRLRAGSAAPGCWTARPPTSAPPAAACTPTSPAPRQRNGHLPAHHLDFRSARRLRPGPALPGRRPPLPAAQDHRRATASLDWHAVTRLLQPQRQHAPPRAPPGPGPGPRPAWPAGSPPSPKATATPACSGPPTAPWKPTRPPT